MTKWQFSWAKSSVLSILCGLASLAPSLAVAQDDVLAGREKAKICETCHGLDGLSKIPEAPNLAGQTPQYLAAQLTAFHNGDRKNEMMSVVAQSLTPSDIAALAAYYSSIEITVGKIPGQ